MNYSNSSSSGGRSRNPMEDILRQLQSEAGEAPVAPEEEMTHVAGVSFVDAAGLSLGAAPEEEAGHAGAYRYIANCANALEALVLQGDDDDDGTNYGDGLGVEDSGRGLRHGRGEGHEEYAHYRQEQQRDPSTVDGRHHHHHHHHHHRFGANSSNGFARSSTRLKGKDRHVVIQRKAADEVAVVVLTKKPEDNSDDDEDGRQSTT